ncbi:MAG TPA: GAF domain-containing protein [Herpetosiphonaceae bacterium]
MTPEPTNVKPPRLARLRERLNRWHSWPIRAKLGAGFGLLLAGIVVLAALSLSGLGRVRANYQAAFDRAVENERLARAIDSALLQARRNEKDFLLRWRDEGFGPAYERYVVAVQLQVAAVQTATASLRERISRYQSQNDMGLLGSVDQVQSEIGRYGREFMALVGLLNERGFDNTGLEGEFQVVAGGLEDYFRQARVEPLLFRMSQLRQAEKDYFLRGDPAQATLVLSQTAALRAELAAAGLSRAEREAAGLLLDDYERLFGRLAAIDREAAAHDAAFREAAQTIEPLASHIAETEQRNAGLDVAAAQRISSSIFAWTLGGIAAILALAALIGALLTREITAPIRGLAGAASQITGGDLSAQAPVIAGDELGMFAQSFNTMTATLRQTLEDLEQRRRQVEREQRRSEDLINGIIPIGVALTAERDFGNLLEMILGEARKFCRAEAGSLYLKVEDDQLRPVIAQNERLNLRAGGASGQLVALPPLALHVADGAPNQANVTTVTALRGQSINIADVYDQQDAFDFSGPREFDRLHAYRTVSFLSIPLKNAQAEVIGVLQLINARHPDTQEILPFDSDMQQMVESLSSLAAAALAIYAREQHLRQEIQQLRIEIDQSKQERMIAEITETDFFRDLQQKARDHRAKKSAAEQRPPPPAPPPAE